MVSKKSPPPPNSPSAPKPSALPLDSMPTVSARSPQSLDEEATLIYGSTKGAAGRLQIEEGSHAGEEVLLSTEPCIIGRSSECALVLRRSAGISRKHAQVIVEGGLFFVEDLGSRNGTKLNGKRITGRAPLFDGDHIGISSEKIRFIGPPMQAAERQAEVRPANPSTQETALVEAPQLQALLAESARSAIESDADPDSQNSDDIADAATLRQPAIPEPPSHASNSTLSSEFDAGVPTSTDAMPRKASDANPSPSPSPSSPPPAEHTDLRKPQSSPPLPTAAAQELPYSEPKKSSSLGLLVGLVFLVSIMGTVAYDFLLNDGAIFNSVLGESERPVIAPAVQNAATVDNDPVADSANADSMANPLAASATSAPPVATPTNVASPPSPPTPDKAPEAATPKRAIAPAPPVVVQQAIPQKTAATTKKGTLVPVNSQYTGVVEGMSLQVGSRVRAGEIVATISRLPAAQARKKKALRREEKLFAPLAANGDERAARDLATVRKELREVEASRQQNTVRAPVSGTVQQVGVRNGQSIGTDTPLVVIAAEE